MKVWWADHPDEEITEIAWERQMVSAGMEAFQTQMDGKEASQTSTGQRRMQALVRTVTTGIIEMQKETIGKERIEREVKGTVILMPPAKAALFTVKAMLDKTYGSEDAALGVMHQPLCKQIGRAIETELNFVNWLDSSKEAAKDYAKAQGWAARPTSHAERLIKEHGISSRTLRRWRSAFEELREYEWDDKQLLYCGRLYLTTAITALAKEAEEAGKEPPFEEYLRPGLNKRKKKFVRMNPDFKRAFDDAEMTIARFQVIRLPMLKRPRPWTQQETEE